jgi:hypothetical protein
MDIAHPILGHLDSLTFGYSSCSWQSSGTTVNGVYRPKKFKIEFTYFDWALNRENYIKAVNAVEQKTLSVIKDYKNDNMSDREKVIKIHEYLIKTTVYDRNGKYCNTPYGALIDGKTICGGYSYAFQYICEELDIPCVIAFGTTDNPDDAHVWNKVKLGDNWYIVDLTLDNNDDTIPNYTPKFSLFTADSEYKGAIEVDFDGIEEPQATDTKNSYYEATGAAFSDYTKALKYVETKAKGALPRYIALELSDTAVYNKFKNGAFWDDLVATGVFNGKSGVSAQWWFRDDSKVIIIKCQ